MEYLRYSIICEIGLMCISSAVLPQRGLWPPEAGLTRMI